MLIEIFPPAPELASVYMHGMLAKLDGCETRMPVRPSPALLVCIRGKISMVDQSGVKTLPRMALRGPVMGPSCFLSEPDTLALLISFRPGLLHPGLGVSPGDIVGRYVDLGEYVGDGRIKQLLDVLDKTHESEQIIQAIQEFLFSVTRYQNTRGIAGAYRHATDKLFLPLADLALQFNLGSRQLERRAQQAFGMPLREIRRVSRFGFTMPKILAGACMSGNLGQLAQDAGYYDQAHMHREFLEWSGMSPTDMLKKISGDDPAYWLYRLSPADYTNLFIPSY